MEENKEIEEVEVLDEVSDTKKKKNHSSIILIVLILLICISIGYSYLSANLKVLGGVGIPQMSWDIHFENLEEDSDNTVSATNPAIITSENTKITFDVDLEVPSDKYGFDVDIVNNGTIDAMVSGVDVRGISVDQLRLIEYDLTYADGSPIEEKDLIKAGESKKIHFDVKYKDTLNDDDETMSVIVDINYMQADETAVDKD